jgi:Putative peptidoglycan binding domain
MKLIAFLPALAAVSTLFAPISAYAKEKSGRGEKSSKNDRPILGISRGKDDRKSHDRKWDNKHKGHDHDHRGPHVVIRPSFGYGYGSYYGHSPYYYSRPSIGFSYYSRPSTTYRGSVVYGSYSDSLAVDVQRELRRRGYYLGPIDGDIGPGSRAAIRAYQYDRGLSVTGRIDSSLLRALDIG